MPDWGARFPLGSTVSLPVDLDGEPVGVINGEVIDVQAGSGLVRVFIGTPGNVVCLEFNDA